MGNQGGGRKFTLPPRIRRKVCKKSGPERKAPEEWRPQRVGVLKKQEHKRQVSQVLYHNTTNTTQQVTQHNTSQQHTPQRTPLLSHIPTVSWTQCDHYTQCYECQRSENLTMVNGGGKSASVKEANCFVVRQVMRTSA